MRKLLLSLLLSTFVLSAQDTFQPTGRKLWKISLVSLATANAMDVHSSWGKHELNSTLGNSSGRFGTQGALIKLGMQGGVFGVEYLITRGHPTKKLYRALSVVNFGAAAGVGSMAVRNYGIPR